VKTFTYDTPNAVLYGMRPAPDGSVWIAMLGTNVLGRVDTATGAIKPYKLPNAGARPRRLQVAPDGMVYYTDYERGYLGRLDPKSGQVKEWKSPSDGAGPYGIAIGTDGRIWYNEAQSSQMIAFDPRTEKMEIVKLPTAGAIVRHMVTDVPRKRIWLALSGTGRIGKIDLGGGM
jgi:virginiamycin B lyase